MTTRREPAQYHFYEEEINKAYEEDDWERVSYLRADAPVVVRDALIRNGILEGSVEQTRLPETLL